MNTKNTTAIATTDQNTGYLTETVNLAELFSEELDGLRPSFERIKIPAENKSFNRIALIYEKSQLF